MTENCKTKMQNGPGKLGLAFSIIVLCIKRVYLSMKTVCKYYLETVFMKIYSFLCILKIKNLIQLHYELAATFRVGFFT